MTKRQVAIKTESAHSKYPLILYEANVTLLLHGINLKKLNKQG